MHVLERNKQDIWYANPTGSTTYKTDVNGYKTGEKERAYTTAVKLRMWNRSPLISKRCMKTPVLQMIIMAMTMATILQNDKKRKL